MLKLTEAQLAQALNGLNPSERVELLQLLEQRERLEAERPVDERPSWEEFFVDTTAEDAAASGDPAGYLAANTAHMACYERHAARLEAERPEPADLIESMEWFRQLCDEASACATADGYPPARDLFPKAKAADPLPHDPIEVARRASLPRSVQRDLEDSRVRHAEVANYEHIMAEQKRADAEPVVVDKLAAFRDQTPPGLPPSWPDY